MVNLSVDLCGLKLDNPVIPASGCFGYGKEFAEYYDINILGSFSFKGTTLESRFGNSTPRIAETPNGMLNAVGLQNPGAEHVIAHELPEMKGYFHKPVIANVSGFSIEEYEKTCALLDRQEQVGIKHFLSQRSRRRHGLRHKCGKCGGGDQSREGCDEKTGVHQAFAQRNGYRIHCQSL